MYVCMYEISDVIYIIKGHLPSAAFDKSLLKHLYRRPKNSKTQKMLRSLSRASIRTLHAMARELTRKIAEHAQSFCRCVGSFDIEKSENCWVLCIVTFSNIPLLQKTKAINKLLSVTKQNSKDRAGIEQIK